MASSKAERLARLKALKAKKARKPEPVVEVKPAEAPDSSPEAPAADAKDAKPTGPPPLIATRTAKDWADDPADSPYIAIDHNEGWRHAMGLIGRADPYAKRQPTPQPPRVEFRPMPTRSVNRDDFIAKHNGRLPLVKLGRHRAWFLLRDGAKIAHDGDGEVFLEPNPDPLENWRDRREYAAERVRTTGNAISHIRAAFNLGGPPFKWDREVLGSMPDGLKGEPSDQYALIDWLSEKLSLLRAKLAKIDAEPIAAQAQPAPGVYPLGLGNPDRDPWAEATGRGA